MKPTLTELRWVAADELESLELLPVSIKGRLLEDAPGGWLANRTYLEGDGD